MNNQKTKNEAQPTIQVQQIVMCDKNGVEIKPGQRIKIENSRKDISKIGTVVIVNDEFTDGENRLMIKDDVSGKNSSVEYNLDAIWWANDEPENFLEVLST